MRCKINVSGTLFEFDGKMLEKFSHHTLTDLFPSGEFVGNEEEVFVGRSAETFAAILGYYQTGELHMPTTVCPQAFRQELEFWKVPAEDMQTCCSYRFSSFFPIVCICFITSHFRHLLPDAACFLSIFLFILIFFCVSLYSFLYAIRCILDNKVKSDDLIYKHFVNKVIVGAVKEFIFFCRILPICSNNVQYHIVDHLLADRPIL